MSHHFWCNKETFRTSNKNIFIRGYTLDYRYKLKTRPKNFNVCCPACKNNALMLRAPEPKAKAPYKSSLSESHDYDDSIGGWSLKKSAQKVTGPITGAITCPHCGFNKETTVQWPQDAYYQFALKENLVWAWNMDYLKLLRNWVAAEIRDESKLDNAQTREGLALSSCVYFLATLPKFILLKKNRDIILKRIDNLLAE